MDISGTEIRQRIHIIRGQKVILDDALAEFYEVETRILKRAVRRNITRFPNDFMFELTEMEMKTLISQFGISKPAEDESRGGNRFYPFAFTELGVGMISSVLNSERAIQTNIAIMRALTQLRYRLEANGELTSRIDRIEGRLDLLESNVAQILRMMRNASTASLEESTKDPAFRRETITGPTIEAIQKAVSEYYELEVHALKASSRAKKVALARQIAMYLVRRHTNMGLREIGASFGGRDHTTVLHGYRRIEAALKEDNRIRAAVESIQNSF